MNDDGLLTVGDVTALSETVVGRQAVRRIAVGGNPYAADNFAFSRLRRFCPKKDPGLGVLKGGFCRRRIWV